MTSTITAPRRATHLHWTDDKKAQRLIASDPLALLVGFLLDQQVPMEWAFAAPQRLKERLDGKLKPRPIARMGTEALVDLFCAKPPLHRYPASMARRTQKLCQLLVTEYGGDPQRLWSDGADAAHVVKRIAALPGFSASKGRVIVAVLAKRLGIEVPGWEQVAPAWFSLADVDSPEALLHYRDLKRAAKKAGKWPPG
ncbi:MAG: HhH-GPD-type base excision DNA repair protein [Candidatus Dormibacteria bacterium]